MRVDREKIIERIRQLRQMTAARGCTEAEALAAAAKAAELMAKIGVTEEDVEIEEATSIFQGRRHAALGKLWEVIARCTNTAVLQGMGGRGDGVIFFGATPGPEIAVYLREVCDRAVARELATFKDGTFYKRRRTTKTRKAAIGDFLDGLIVRLCARLYVLFKASRSEPLRLTAEKALSDRYATTTVAVRSREMRFSEAAWQGHVAGGRPNLSHGVGGANGGPAALIGRGRTDA